MSTIWVEKYRPQKLNDVILAPATRKILQTILESPDIFSNMTNFLFSGPPGGGKTTCAKIIPRTLNLPLLYINASEENGIDVLRNRVKDFSMSQTIDEKLKIVVLDESEQISIPGQLALRNIIEVTHKNTRFILTCNYPEKIIQPLHSRLREIVFSKPDEKVLLKRITEIFKEEKIKVPQEQVQNLLKLVRKFYPDIRKIINHLQNFSVSGILEIEFNDLVSEDLFEQIIIHVKDKKLSAVRSILRNNKVDTEGIVRKVFDEVLKDESIFFSNLNESKRAEICLLCADNLFKNNFVVDKEINFIAFIIELSKIGI